MINRVTLNRILLWSMLVLAASPVAGTDVDPDLKAGFLGRLDGLKSGKLTWRMRRTTSALPELTQERALVFEGALWRADYFEPSGARANPTSNRPDGVYELGAAHPADKFSFKMLISQPRSFYDKQQCSTWGSNGGTVFHEVTKRYVKLHKDELKFVGNVTYQGMECPIIELPVSQDNLHEATHVVCPSMVLGGGVMRFVVSPSLGFCVPSYQFIDSSGVIRISIDASNFKERGGIFFPENVDEDWKFDTVEYRHEFQYSLIDQLNERIDPKELEFEIPERTEVRDARPKKNYRFVMDGPPLPIDDLELWFTKRLSEENAKEMPLVSVKREKSYWLWLVGGNVCAGIILGVVIWRRRLRRV